MTEDISVAVLREMRTAQAELEAERAKVRRLESDMSRLERLLSEARRRPVWILVVDEEEDVPRTWEVVGAFSSQDAAEGAANYTTAVRPDFNSAVWAEYDIDKINGVP